MTYSLQQFERDAITRLCVAVIDETALSRILAEAEVVDVDHTGVGYFLTLRHSELPTGKRTVDSPYLLGESGDVCVGFMVFLGDHELTLECFNLGTRDDVPLTVRELPLDLRVLEQS